MPNLTPFLFIFMNSAFYTIYSPCRLEPNLTSIRHPCVAGHGQQRRLQCKPRFTKKRRLNKSNLEIGGGRVYTQRKEHVVHTSSICVSNFLCTAFMPHRLPVCDPYVFLLSRNMEYILLN
jgi:hypothetical protein